MRMMLMLLSSLSFRLIAGAATATDADTAAPPTLDHMDPSLPVDTRVAALLAKMTNREKAAQTVLFTAWQNNASAYAKALEHYSSTGVGALSGEACDDQHCTRLAYQNAAQAAIIKSSRLHIPASFICETLHSADGISTIFPMPCLQGATWDTALVRAVATSIAVQARAGGVDRGFSPEINVCTDPRFGRTGEIVLVLCWSCAGLVLCLCGVRLHVLCLCGPIRLCIVS
eukprot:SAG31_NODE_1455_length_8278_cov_2.514366_4_plen_229_part_00